MRFLVICRPAADGDQDDFKRLTGSRRVMAEQMMRLRRMGCGGPGGMTRVASRPASAKPAATNIATPVR